MGGRSKEERVGSVENCTNLAKKYSSNGFLVDDSARIRIIVILSTHATLSDALNITEEVVNCRGIINYPVLPPVSHFQIEIDSWIPFDKIEQIMKLPIVAGSTRPPIMITH
jgi:hypothetical protein